MKIRRGFAIILMLSIMLSVPSMASVRWAQFKTIVPWVEVTPDGVDWGATVAAYANSNVTYTEVEVELQVKTTAGWGTVDSDSSKSKGTMASCGGLYTGNNIIGEYRVVVYASAYTGSTGNSLLESVGPIYSYR